MVFFLVLSCRLDHDDLSIYLPIWTHPYWIVTGPMGCFGAFTVVSTTVAAVEMFCIIRKSCDQTYGCVIYYFVCYIDHGPFHRLSTVINIVNVGRFLCFRIVITNLASFSLLIKCKQSLNFFFSFGKRKYTISPLKPHFVDTVKYLERYFFTLGLC